MQWHEITIYTSEEAVEAVSHFLHELGAGGVSIEESATPNKKRDTSLGQWYDEVPFNDIPEGCAVIKGYFAGRDDIDDLVAKLGQDVAGLTRFGLNPGEARVETSIVDEEDWANAWKQYYKPIRVSDTLTIKPTWEPYSPSPGEQIIELDPGMAFGTGTHPTTALCLRTLEETVRGGENVIDVGTGSGILAIGACRLGARRVLALDLDPVAVSSAEENIRLNGLDDHITVKESDLLQALREGESQGAVADALGVRIPVQLVIANILADIIVQFVDDVYEVLESGGQYIASGIYKNKERDVELALTKAGFAITRIEREEDWSAIVARKP